MQLAQFAGSLISLAFYIAPLAIVIGSIWVARRIYKRKDRRNPLTRDLLRGPGHTLKDKLDGAKDDLAAYMAAAIPVPLLLLASWSLQDRIDGKRSPFPLVFVFFLVVAAGFFVFAIFRLVKKIRNDSLGYEAEQAVGQELNQLTRLGFHVFHDVDGDKLFNIDHVVVGVSGVFAVETKGRAKPLENGKPQYVVQLQDDRLIFPRWTESEPITQAIRNAKWLSKWLSSATGERVEVHPVLALPGWYIERKTKSSVFVFNATNSANTLGKWSPSSLSSQTVERVVHQLDAKCRDISPSAR
jgi:hypothetical protein